MCIHVIAGCGNRWCFETSESLIITDGEPELLQNTPRCLLVKPAKTVPAEKLVKSVDEAIVVNAEKVPQETVPHANTSLEQLVVPQIG